MNDRIISLLGALFAFALVVQLLMPQQPDPSKLVSFPTTENRGKHGFWVLDQWLQNNHIPTMSLRDRIDELKDNATLSKTGNILIISLPTRSNFRKAERKFLSDWIGKGNTLLVFASMHDAPAWSRYNHEGTSQILDISEIDYYYDEDSDEDDDETDSDPEQKPSVSEIIKKIKEPNTEIIIKTQQYHPIFTNIEHLTLEKNTLGFFNGLENVSDENVMVPLLYEEDSPTTALWFKSLKGGEIWFFTHADVINNVRMEYQQNAQFINNLIALKLSENGTIIFDDFHQGLTDIYDPEAFFNDPRLHTTLWFVFIFWLIYIIGHSSRFGPLETRKKAYNSLNFVSALGNFIARHCSAKTVAMELLHHFNNEIRSKRFMPANGEPVWSVLEKSPAISHRLLDEFKQLCRIIERDKKFSLKKFYNQLQLIRKQL